MRNRYSYWAFLLVYTAVLVTHFFYYPKWKLTGPEATISWDVSGYYMYLPASFIYGDLKQCAFKDEILNKYSPTYNFQQAFKHEKSGNYVMKYSTGQALAYAPAFFLSHAFASLSDAYEADGFSRPYQIGISLWSLLITLIGLIYLRKTLLLYFEDVPVAWAIIFIGIGSNYLNYTAIDGAQTHNYLFTYYALLLWSSHQFHKKPSWKYALAIGCLVGIATLTRPTEIISLLLPLLWGVKLWDTKAVLERLELLWSLKKYIVSSAMICVLIGTIQIIYWKYVSGEWLVYSYEDQGFSWLSPHFFDGFLSYKAGWLVYSPIMVFSLIGFLFLFLNRQKIAPTIGLFTFLFIYLAFAWDVWWYGGSLGQRTMVQCYPILAFPLSSFIAYVEKRKFLVFLTGVTATAFIYINLWFLHHSHRGNIVKVGQTTKAYFWKTLGRNHYNRDHLKLLDNEDYFEGEMGASSILASEDFEDSLKVHTCELGTIEGRFSYCLTKEHQYSSALETPLDTSYSWLRISADFRIQKREWNYWNGMQFICEFLQNDEKIKSNLIRVHRFLDNGDEKNIYLDAKIPKGAERIRVFCWNANGKKAIIIDNLSVLAFNPK